MKYSIDELNTLHAVFSSVEDTVNVTNMLRLFNRRRREFDGTQEEWDLEFNRAINELQNYFKNCENRE